jgi:hypothetical protein
MPDKATKSSDLPLWRSLRIFSFSCASIRAQSYIGRLIQEKIVRQSAEQGSKIQFLAVKQEMVLVGSQLLQNPQCTY